MRQAKNVNEVPFLMSDWRSDPHWMVKSFFNYVYEQGALVDALKSITQRCGYAYNEEYLFFPDLGDPDPNFHFDGVTFGMSNEEVIITERECWHYVRQAAAFWIERNNADAVSVESILPGIPG